MSVKNGGELHMNTAILHYSAPPVVGGVEMVIHAHAEQFLAAGMPITVIAGRGQASALPPGAAYTQIAEIDSLHPEISAATEVLNSGTIPDSFDGLVGSLMDQIQPVLSQYDNLIVHNVFTKHFNLPLTAALFRLMDAGSIKNCIAWCHDLTWSSERSRGKVFSAYPWDLLKTYKSQITYVAISQQRRKELIETTGCPSDKVRVVYNGVDPALMLGLSTEAKRLIDSMDILSADLILLMPVRITKAKNIELAIRVVEALKKMRCSARIILTGPPDPHDTESMAYFRSLLELRRQMGVENEMKFVYEFGPNPDEGLIIDRKTVFELYRVVDALFMPSHKEGFGMPLVEAGILGLPIITTRVPSYSELMDGKALAVPPDMDPTDLAKEILNWLESKPEYHNKVKVRRSLTWKVIFERDILRLLTKPAHP